MILEIKIKCNDFREKKIVLVGMTGVGKTTIEEFYQKFWEGYL